jgi:hypothetical protein
MDRRSVELGSPMQRVRKTPNQAATPRGREKRRLSVPAICVSIRERGVRPRSITERCALYASCSVPLKWRFRPDPWRTDVDRAKCIPR